MEIYLKTNGKWEFFINPSKIVKNLSNKIKMKTTDKSPDYRGYIKIEDKVYRLSAWVKTKGGKKSLSLKAVEADYEGSINSL